MSAPSVCLITPHSRWPIDFQSAKERLTQLLPATVRSIHHVGSTSLGIAAKPYIDMAVVVNDLSDVEAFDFKALAREQYYRIRGALGEEVVICRFNDDRLESKTHIVHCVAHGSLRWQQIVVFKEILQQNEALKQRYLDLKRMLASKHAHDIDAYSLAKSDFVNQILAQHSVAQ